MSIFGGIFNGIGGWFGWNNLAVPDPHAPPANPEVVKPAEPLDRTQSLAPFGSLTGYGTLPGFDDAPPPSIALRWQMRRYYTIALAHAIVCRPILGGAQTAKIKDDKGNPKLAEQMQKDAEHDLLPRVMDWLPGALESPHFGNWLQEIIWDRAQGRTVPVGFERILPGEATLYKDAYGRFSGYQYRQEYRDKRYGFLAVNDEHVDPIFGYSRNDNCREEWWRIRQSEINADRTERKASGIQMGIGAPTGRSSNDDSGNAVMPFDTAQAIVNAAQQGQTFLYPLMFFDKESIARNPDLAKVPAVQITPFDWGNTGPAMMSHLARKAELNVAIMRAWCRPEREAMEGQHGTKAESETQGEIGTTDSEYVAQQIMRQFSRQVVEYWRVTNYGPDAPVIAIEQAPLSDPQQQFLQDFAKALAQDTNTGQEFQANVDQRQLLHRVEVPMVDQKTADAKIAEMQAANAAKQQAAAAQLQQQPPNGNGDRQANGQAVPAVNGKKNGNGRKNGNRLALSGDEDREPHLVAASRLMERIGVLQEPSPVIIAMSGEDEGGHWVTIEGEHVYIKGGVITKGPAHLVGKDPSHLDDNKAPGQQFGHGIEPDETVAARSIEPPHEVREHEKLAQITESMKESGWRGRPLLVEQRGDGWQGLTGSHRIDAARKARIDVPIVKLDQDKLRSYLEENGEDPTQTLREHLQSIGADNSDQLRILREIGDERAAKLMEAEERAREAAERAGTELPPKG